MRRSVARLLVLGVIVLSCALTGSAPEAQADVAPAAGAGLTLPLQDVSNFSKVPPGFSSDANTAVKAAEATPKMQALHRAHHPLQYLVQIWAGSRWEVDFYYKNRILAEVDVDRAGRAGAVWTGPLAIDYAARGHYGGLFDSPWVVLPFCVLFLVPFVDPRRPFRLRHLDLLVLLSFGVSYWLFNNAHFELAVLLVYPALLYLLARMLTIGAASRGRVPTLSVAGPTWLPAGALAGGLVALVGARIGLDLASDKVIDVGYASVIGAHRIAHGLPLYYASAAHGDTYGPIAYLAYVPFQWLFQWHGGWDYLPAARAAAIVFDVLTIAGLVVLGTRLRPGRAGRRLGLSLGWAWAAFPFSLFGLMNNTNDGLLAMLLVFSLLLLGSPVGRGAMLGLAAAAKFFPIALLPVLARGSGLAANRGHSRTMLTCAAVCLSVVALSIAIFLPTGGVSEFYDHTIGFQLGRNDPFSLWGLHASLDWLRTVVMIGAIALAAAVAFVPRGVRTVRQVAALSAAVVIAVQLPAEHWFYFYIVWFAPLVLVALLVPAPRPIAERNVEPYTAVGEPSPEPIAVAV